ncbi:MAG TPA: DNA repair protein RecO [Spirochaetota bacterium]|nr:DNA repair protein RecO [Spirochaetota bacterium]
MSEQRHVETEAYILKTSKSGDSARYFTFISPTIGITNCIAFGAERLKSRFCSTIQPFTKAKLFLYLQPKNNQYKIEDISEVESNDFIKSDMKFIQIGYFFIDILTNSYIEQNEFKSYFYLLSYSLEIIKEQKDIRKSFLFFVTKFLFLSGYGFNLNCCLNCKKEFAHYHFDFNNGGIFCDNCSKINSNTISISQAQLLKTFFDKKYIELKDIQINQSDFKGIFDILICSLKNIFEKELKTFDTINEIFK